MHLANVGKIVLINEQQYEEVGRHYIISHITSEFCRAFRNGSQSELFRSCSRECEKRSILYECACVCVRPLSFTVYLSIASKCAHVCTFSGSFERQTSVALICEYT